MNIWGFNTPNLPTQLGGAPDPAVGIPLFSTPSPLLEEVARLRPASGGGFGRRGLDLPHVAASCVLGGYGYRASGGSCKQLKKFDGFTIFGFFPIYYISRILGLA
jgi:hypothetical protein